MVMTTHHYITGEEIRSGDQVLLHGEPGEVEFVIASKTGDPDMDWYLNEHPDGGIMIKAASFGSVFLSSIDERLKFVSRPVK